MSKIFSMRAVKAANSVFVNSEALSDSEKLMNVAFGDDRQLSTKYFGTWFPSDPALAIQAIGPRIEGMEKWISNLKTLEGAIQKDLKRRDVVLRYLEGLSDEEIDQLDAK